MWIAARLQANFLLALFFFVGAGNLLLAIFNLFPGYPLDGGRVLRAIIWKRSGSIRDATRIAGFCGQLMALVLIAFGIYMVRTRQRNLGAVTLQKKLRLFWATGKPNPRPPKSEIRTSL